MDFLVVLLIVFGVFNSIYKRIQKQAQKTNQSDPHAIPRFYSPAASPEFAKKTTKIRQTDAKPSLEKWKPEAYKVLAPSIHGWQEGESAFSGQYVGSLGVASMEGMDLCDPGLGHRRTDESIPSPIYDQEIGSDALSLSFSPDAMIQGVIMSEILASPSQAKWGKNRWKNYA